MGILSCEGQEFHAQVQQAAIDYCGHGWQVVLLHGVVERQGQAACTCSRGLNCASPGKHPRLTGWPELATSDEDAITEQLERLPCSNIGIRLGPTSGVCDVEFDCEEGRRTAERLLGSSFTPTYSSHRSVHRLYRFPDTLALPSVVVKAKGLEMRFGTEERGSQSVAPPSLHAMGTTYAWLAGLSPQDVEPEPFPDCLAELAEKATVGGGSGSSNGDGFTMGGDFWDSPGAKPGERNAMLTRMTGRYLATYGTGDLDNLLQHARAWNARCQPPKPDSDVDKVVTYLYRKEKAKREATPQTQAAQPASGNGQVPARPKARLVTRRYSDIESKPIQWLYANRIPRGMVTMLAGNGGWGKSTIATDVAARVSTGKAFPDGSLCGRGDVVLVSAEESAEYTVKARLEALGADCSRIHDLAYVEDVAGERPLTLPEDTEAVREMLASLPQARLVVVDTIADVMGNIDENKNLAVRRALAPLKRLAEEFALAVICIAHVGKARDVSADSKVLGSVAFTNLARVTWHVGPDPDDSEPDRKRKRRLWLPGKANIPIGNGMAFHTQWTGSAVVPQWEEGEVFGDANTLYQSRPAQRESKTEEVEAFLRLALANGPRVPGDVVDQGETLGYAKRTIYRVAKAEGITASPSGLWQLPQGDSYTF